MPETTYNPYVGPRTFAENERNFFFGREREARDLLSLVLSNRLVLFYAPSGAGKSSLINARLLYDLVAEGFGVLPVGRVSGGLPDGTAQPDNVFIFNLILSLEQGHSEPTRFIRTTLSEYLQQRQPETQDMQSEHAPPRLLVIDQFEELFTTNLSHWEKREDFFRQLAQALNADPLLWVILVLREEYVAGLDPYAQLLPGRLRTRFYMQPLGPQAALDTIVKPAKGAGRAFAPGVAQSLVDNLRQIRTYEEGKIQLGQFVEPVQLQVVCYQLWENLKNQPPGEITQEDVQRLGNVDRALAQFYEQAIATALEKTGESEVLLRDWFERKLITETGARGTVYRGPEKTEGLANRTVDLLEEQFIVRAESRAGGTWYELVHDRLINPILTSNQEWLKQHPLIRDVYFWRDSNEDSNRLYRENQLETVRATISDRQALDPLVEKFLEESEIAVTKRREKEAQRQQELQKAKRDARRRLWLGLAYLILAMLAFGTTVWAFRQRVETEQQGQTIESMRLASTARNYLDTQPDLALLLSLEAMSKAENVVQAKSSLSEGLTSQGSLLLGILEGHSNRIYSIVFSSDGQLLASGSDDSAIILWDVSSPPNPNEAIGDQVESSQINSPNPVKSVAFSSDDKFLASGHDDGTILLWNVETEEPMGTPLAGHRAAVNSLVFSPEEGDYTLASGSADHTIIFWDIETGEKIHTLSGHYASVQSVAFSPDGRILASGGDDRRINLWDTHTGEEIQQLPPQEGPVQSLAFSPDGQMLASGGSDGKIILWVVNPRWWGITGEFLIEPKFALIHVAKSDHSLVERGYDANPVFSVVFSPDGQSLASGYAFGEIILWDISNGMEIGALDTSVFGGRKSVYSLAFSPDGKTLASSAGADGRIILWDVDPESWQEHACRLAQRNLTWSEWQKFIEPSEAKQTLPQLLAVGPDLDYRKTCQDFPVHESVIIEGIVNGRMLVREGDIKEAIAWFEQIRELDPSIDLDPEAEVAQTLADQSRLAASMGDIEGAERLFVQALDLDPNVNLDLEAEIAMGLAKLGRDYARKGDIENAQHYFEQASKKEPNLKLTPEAEIARILVERGRELMAVGDIDSAQTLFQKALDLDSNLNLDPTAEIAQGWLIWGENLALQGQITEAMAVFDQAQRRDPDLKIPPDSWNILCRYGSLGGEAEAVTDACNKAVALAPDDGWYHHDRGVARALTEDYEGAIEDFNFFLNWLETYGDYDQYGPERERWIQILEGGQNPIDSKVLGKLQNEL
jgi:WD40 repeat protein/tetratricopeptide (TPR) repeat protein